MAFNWTVKKQLSYLAFFFLIAAVVAAVVFLKVTSPTCFDGKQNQNEEDIDCGEICNKKCLGEIREPIVSWVKAFGIGEDKYEAIALVKNPNLFLYASIKYQFKFYAKNNILVSIKEGETYLNPGEDFPVFETGIFINGQAPSEASFEIKGIKWERLEKNRPQLLISKKEFINSEPFPRLDVVVNNTSVSAVGDIYSVAVLYDRDKNAVGASATIIDNISGGGSEQLSFTWPKLFPGEPASIEIFFRTDLRE